MFSLRDLMWTYIYGGGPSAELQTKEILISVAIAILLLCSYWLFQKIIFYGINESARSSRTGARVIAICLAVGWLGASLDLMGMWTSVVMVSFVVMAMIVDFAYLFLTRRA
ncbi:MAG: hypothetical protein M3Y07_10990 [Acidobacteriota bacterium]|nr:hypothetical protein [Acidobacteriota bacterium]